LLGFEIVLEQIFTSDRPLLSQPLYLFSANLGVGGEEDDLVAGLGEVAVNEVAAVFGVEATEGGVDRDGELPTGGACEAPQESDREDLFFASGEAVFGDGVTVGVVEAEAKGIGVNLDALDQVAFAEQVAEVLGDEVFEFVELL